MTDIKLERRKYQIPINGSIVSLPPDQRPKKVVQPDKPEGLELKRAEYWCPYCARAVIFKHNEYVGIEYCPRCGISDRDFYVRRANNLWRD